MANKRNPTDYGKVALILVTIVIGVWFFSNFRVSIIPVNEIKSIGNVTYYDCPGVGLQTQNNAYKYIGCRFSKVDQVIKSEVLKRGLVLWWK